MVFLVRICVGVYSNSHADFCDYVTVFARKSFTPVPPYPRLQVLPQWLSASPVPEAQSHLHLPQKHVPPQGLGVPHRQVQGPAPQLSDSYFILEDENQNETGNTWKMESAKRVNFKFGNLFKGCLQGWRHK